MKVHITTPFSMEKRLAIAYNETMQAIPDDDWCCLTDGDILFLTPDFGTILHQYAYMSPDAGILTCFTNRVSKLSPMQLLTGHIDENSNIAYHILKAEKQREKLYHTSVIHQKFISGFLMLISKKTWNEFKFDERFKCLGVDTEYSRRLSYAGKTIVRMDGMYVWHTYRLMAGVDYKNHLL